MGDKRFLRAVVAAGSGAVLAVTLASPAVARQTSSEAVSGAAHDRLDVSSSEHRRVPAGASAAADATVSGFADVPAATCPRGTRLTRTLVAESFETSLPDPGWTHGWERVASDAVAGSWVARSTWAGPNPTPSVPAFHELYFGDPAVAPGSTVYLSFASRGSDVFTNTYFGAEGDLWGDDLTPEWTRIQVPISKGIQPDGSIFPVIAHQQGATAATSWEVDDVKVLVCGPVPATGVRGDWTGDAKVDVLGTTAPGDLVVFPGTNGNLDDGFTVGGGWASMTFLGSPGDVNGDRRTDLIARSANGNLYLYAGVGDGGFRKAVQIGQKWNGMTALVTPGDVENNGRPDLLARRNDGTLHLYQFTVSGGLTYTRQVGRGWSGMAWMVGAGDMDGDKRGDVIGVHQNGDVYSYRGTPTGLVTIGKIASGWQDRTWVSSPGDLSGDGRGDLLSRDGDGRLYLHSGSATGLGSGLYLSAGWDQFVRIL